MSLVSRDRAVKEFNTDLEVDMLHFKLLVIIFKYTFNCNVTNWLILDTEVENGWVGCDGFNGSNKWCDKCDFKTYIPNK